LDENDRPLLVIPLHVQVSGKQTLAYLWGEFSQAGYLDFLYDSELTAGILQEALALISRDLGGVRLILSRVPGASRLNELIEAALDPRHYTRTSSPCVHIPMSGNFDEFMKGLSKSVRQTLRTSVNRMRNNQVSHEVRTFVNQPIPFSMIKKLFTLYWNRLAEKKINLKLRKYLPFFMRTWLNPAIIALTRLPNVYCSIIYIDKTIAGFCAGFTTRDGTVVLPFLAIDSRFSAYNPGGLLIVDGIRHLMEEHQFKYFDLSRGNETYKYQYGGREHLNYCYEINLASGM
jgi:hypothetical protein